LQKQVGTLTRELKEANERQTATAEVLQVINSSPGDLAPVFDAMLENATRLCEASYGHVWRFDGELLHSVAVWGDPWFREWLQEHSPVAPIPGSAADRIVRGEDVVHVADRREEEAYSSDPVFRGLVDASGMRASLSVALRLDGTLLGMINVYRQEVRPFSDKQIALLQNFGGQAVVAMENARLISETREALERQTATAEVLQVINSSPGNLAPVFDAILDKAHRLCGVSHGSLQLYDGDAFRAVAVHGLSPAFEDRLRQGYRPGPNQPSRRLLEGARVVHVPDLGEIDDPVARAAADLSSIRTTLYIPLRNNGTLLGNIVAARQEVRPFTEKEIALLESFAGQAVIAMENARLLGELRERQAELRVTFDNMGDGVVMFGADTRLVAWNRNFQTILDLPDELVARRPTYVDYIRILAERGEFGTDDIEGELNRRLQDRDLELHLERTRPDGRVIEVRRNKVPGGGFVLIYSDITERKRAEQAIRAARDAAEIALHELQAAQASLVHAQKMAALGQVTAGIAHEIKNPLNFVNNFAGLSVELLEELKEAAAEALGTLDAGKRAEIRETMAMLAGNLERIAEHGRRADGIVRGMLQHARGGSGDWQATDLNALVEESLNLAYHGARAQDQDFKVTLELDLDRNLAPIEVVSQDVSRVLLNLISNGFYAVTKRGREGDGTFRPLLKIATCEYGEGIEIRVHDNGVGIPPEYCEQLFQPFFTTKPTGEGTGLGLSISYEIITQQHGGTITVDSEAGDFAEFTVRLPRRRHAAQSRNGPAPLFSAPGTK
jgi:PAS domain S-box-containing protein